MERVRKETGGNIDEILSTGESRGHKTKVRHDINKGETNAQTQSTRRRTPQDIRRVEKRDRDKNMSS